MRLIKFSLSESAILLPSSASRVRVDEMPVKSRRIREYVADGNYSLCSRELRGTSDDRKQMTMMMNG